MGQVSAAVAKAIGDPAALVALPAVLTGLHKAFIAEFTLIPPESGSIIAKAKAQQIAYGWANVSTMNGQPYVDLQDHYIPIEEMQKAVHKFMATRAGDVDHNEDECAEIVDSLVVTKALSDAMGWFPGREGWFVGFHIKSAAVWKRFESGELKSFSIAGDAVSVPMEG